MPTAPTTCSSSPIISTALRSLGPLRNDLMAPGRPIHSPRAVTRRQKRGAGKYRRRDIRLRTRSSNASGAFAQFDLPRPHRPSVRYRASSVPARRNGSSGIWRARTAPGGPTGRVQRNKALRHQNRQRCSSSEQPIPIADGPAAAGSSLVNRISGLCGILFVTCRRPAILTFRVRTADAERTPVWIDGHS